jgi:hypothetical protein
VLGEDPTIGAFNLSLSSAFAGMAMAVAHTSNVAESLSPMSFAVITVIPLEAACQADPGAATEGDA